MAAWLFDSGNGESAVYAAMTVRDHPEVDEQHRVLDLLIENIFADKMAYIRGEDWPNSLRMHMVLGNIFEQLGKWGPETDSHTAAFQFKAAIADEQRIRAKDKTFSPSPGLYTKLGASLRAPGQAGAGEGAVQQGHPGVRAVGAHGRGRRDS